MTVSKSPKLLNGRADLCLHSLTGLCAYPTGGITGGLCSKESGDSPPLLKCKCTKRTSHLLYQYGAVAGFSLAMDRAPTLCHKGGKSCGLLFRGGLIGGLTKDPLALLFWTLRLPGKDPCSRYSRASAVHPNFPWLAFSTGPACIVTAGSLGLNFIPQGSFQLSKQMHWHYLPRSPSLSLSNRQLQ